MIRRSKIDATDIYRPPQTLSLSPSPLPRTAPPPLPVCGLRRYLTPTRSAPPPPPSPRLSPAPHRCRRVRGGRDLLHGTSGEEHEEGAASSSMAYCGRIRPAAPPPTARWPRPRRRGGLVRSRGGHSGGRDLERRRQTADDGEE
jgi:hypothetical protein